MYAKNILQNEIPFTIEYLTPTQQLNEYIMTRLRMKEGLPLSFVSDKWNKRLSEEIIYSAQKWIDNGKMLLQNDHLVLTNPGILLADGITADLFR